MLGGFFGLVCKDDSQVELAQRKYKNHKFLNLILEDVDCSFHALLGSLVCFGIFSFYDYACLFEDVQQQQLITNVFVFDLVNSTRHCKELHYLVYLRLDCVFTLHSFVLVYNEGHRSIYLD